MRLRPFAQARPKAQSTRSRRWLTLAIVLLLVVASICAARPRQDVAAASVAVAPDQQGVLTQLWAHLVPPPPADPAQQSVASYLAAHDVPTARPRAPQAWDPAVKAVFDYLRAHGW